MTKLGFFLLLVVTSIASHTVFAGIHAGVQGSLWDISEPDMRVVILEEMTENKKLEKMNDDLKKEFEHHLDNRPGYDIPTAKEGKRYTLTIEWTLPEDKFYLKKQPNGKYEWTLLYAKGTKVYPLKGQRADSWLFVFDASSDKQIEFAKAANDLAKKNGVRLILIMTRGNQRKALGIIKDSVFLMPPDLKKTIPIPAVPAVVGQKAIDTDNFSIITLAEPYDASALMEQMK